jgi:hypothetical protein
VEKVVTPLEGAFRLWVVTVALDTPVSPDRLTETPVVAVLSTLADPPLTLTFWLELAVTFGP